MATVKKMTTHGKVQSKRNSAKSEFTIKAKVNSAVKDFYRRHGDAMSKLAYE